jgi:hypothetical protein
MRFNPIVWLVLFPFVFLSVSPASAQQDKLNFILKDLVDDSTGNYEIVIYNPTQEPIELFWPDDLELPVNTDNLTFKDNLVRDHTGLYMVIDGTGRVYQVTSRENEIEFTRMDPTRYVGYNFGAHVFISKDTLYSLGGYGFWRVNGQLRYFNKSISSWEIVPLNEAIPVNPGGYPGLWLNPQTQSLYYLERYISQDELKDDAKHALSNSLYEQSRCLLLDLNTRNWKVLGTITHDVQLANKTSMPSRLASLPWGEMIAGGSYIKPVYYLYHYEENRIYILDKNKSQQIKNIIEDPARRKRSYCYYRNNDLVLVNTNMEKLVLPLSFTDFQPTQQTIYEPLEETPAWMAMNTLSLAVLILGISLSAFAGYVYFKKRNLPIDVPARQNPQFEKTELELILAMCAKPEFAMLTDEVNFLLGTSKKSVEVQKKHRSDVIKSINEKYTAITGDAEKLITQERLETDRRLMRYVIHPDKYSKLSNPVKRENGKKSFSLFA